MRQRHLRASRSGYLGSDPIYSIRGNDGEEFALLRGRYSVTVHRNGKTFLQSIPQSRTRVIAEIDAAVKALEEAEADFVESPGRPV